MHPSLQVSSYLYGMKHLLTLCFVVLLACGASAQTLTALSKSSDAVNYVGKEVSITDVVGGFKATSDGKKLLDIGGKYPNQALTVVLEGKDITLNPADLVGKKVYVKGTVTLFKDKPEIVVTDPRCIYLFTGK
jgi:hypothetical protein